jgi:ribosome biogenesis protein BMS1
MPRHLQELDALPDPCPRPEASGTKRRGLKEKERLVYAPLADVGGLLFDKDAVYIDIPDWKVQYSTREGAAVGAARVREGMDPGGGCWWGWRC